MNWIKRSCLVVMLSMFSLTCHGQESKLNFWPYQQLRLSLTSEYFRWQEYLLDNSELLTETGTRWGLGLREHNYSRRLMGIVYEADLRAYLGTVNYDGKSQDSNNNFYDVQTKTSYLGGSMVVMGGQRLFYPSVDMLVGMELNSWVRSLTSAKDSAGNYASGYRELYRIMAARAALGSFQRWDGRSLYFQAGIKYPVDIFEFATHDTVTLYPKAAPSFFASVDITRLFPRVFTDASLRIYYDSYRFKASPVVGGFYQPESRMDTVGMALQF